MDAINCSICLDLLKEPVAIPCGHNYCMDCIKDCWSQDDQKDVYSCPQCRTTFDPRPVLNINTQLAELVETLKRTLGLNTTSALCYAGPGEVECDICTGRKLKADMSCLVCLASYCKTHIQPHYEVAPLQKHKLVKACAQLQEKICSRHDKLLEVYSALQRKKGNALTVQRCPATEERGQYCRTDQQCICLLCVMDEHKGHDTVSMNSERAEKQKQLTENQQITKQRINGREKEVEAHKQTTESFKHSVQTVADDSERIFTELIHSIERRRAEVRELIRAQEMSSVARAERRLERLEKDIIFLRSRDAELELLSQMDHIQFFKSIHAISVPLGSDAFPSNTKHTDTLEDMKTLFTGLKEQLEHILGEQIVKISEKVVQAFFKSSCGPISENGFCFGESNMEFHFKFDEEAMRRHEKPVPTPLPDKLDLITGEEDEMMTYSQRVKLYRFDVNISQWKERGTGIIKFLKHNVSGRIRVLMRRERVFKVCANHYITTGMNLKPVAKSNKAWAWLAMDFSDGDGTEEQLAVKFITSQLAEEFKQRFEECQKLL